MSDAAFDALLISTAAIKRKLVGAVNSYGIPTETFSTITSTANCLLQTLDMDLEINRRGKKEVAKYVCFFKITENIAEDDIVEISSRAYVVLGVEDAAGIGHHFEVYLRNLEN